MKEFEKTYLYSGSWSSYQKTVHSRSKVVETHLCWPHQWPSVDIGFKTQTPFAWFDGENAPSDKRKLSMLSSIRIPQCENAIHLKRVDDLQCQTRYSAEDVGSVSPRLQVNATKGAGLWSISTDSGGSIKSFANRLRTWRQFRPRMKAFRRQCMNCQTSPLLLLRPWVEFVEDFDRRIVRPEDEN